MKCPRCGHQNLPDSHFCAKCGSPLAGGGESPAEQTSTIAIQALDEHDEEHPEASAPTEGLPAGSALLVVKRGPNAGSRFLLDNDVTTAGRHPESDIFLDDVTVSRRHAEFRREGGRFVLRDVGSLNGTYLNRERIDETELSGGDEVQIGKFRLVFFAGPRSDA
ncbi:MAG TPA: FHA domain-containing protein [Frankiaceae bacterium]|nr:FHA domain-containing protein [Frankiaceae bacterium]